LPFDVRNQAVVRYDNFHAPSLRDFQSALNATLLSAAAAPTGSPVHTFLPGLYIDRYPNGRTPDQEIAELKAEIKRLQASASIEQGTAAQFERRLTLRRELSSLLSRLIRSTVDNTTLLKEHAGDPAYIQSISAALNQESALLLNEAVMLMQQIPDMVGSVEYNTVAYSFANAADTARAERHYRLAIEAAAGATESAMSQRSFAQFLFAIGRHDEARILYQQALTHVAPDHPMGHQINGYTLQLWAWNEVFIAKDATQGKELFEKAQAEFEAVGNPIVRIQHLAALSQARAGAPPTINASRESGPGLLGWVKKATS
jgi:tetratricopeptide (TPR) repeat protein